MTYHEGDGGKKPSLVGAKEKRWGGNASTMKSSQNKIDSEKTCHPLVAF
jgi:hypothetical protein